MGRLVTDFSDLLYICLLVINILVITKGEENVALRKNTAQSSDYSTGFSSLAVDGNTDSVYSKKSCSHTYNYGINWWCVDLQRELDFQNIRIYNRKTLQYRLKGFELRLSSNGECNKNGYDQSTVCYEDTSNTVQDIYNIDSCNQVKFNGRFVYISVENTNSDKYLTLCEVEIFEKCDQNCTHGCNSNGTCNCMPGYYSDTCDTPCPTNCNNGCQQSNGNCIGGCNNGFYGLNCDKSCSRYCKDGCNSIGICNKCFSGYFGDKCNTSCPTYCNGGCQQSNGNCFGGCIIGNYGDKCDEQCPTNCNGGCQQSNGNCNGGCKKGFWGLKCNNYCNKCNQGCQQNNGYCNNGGCNFGYHGNNCNTPCPTNCYGGCTQANGDCVTCKSGYWGIQCQSQCPTNCKLSRCDKTSGYCTECKNYYRGDKCKKRCSTNCKYHRYTTCYQTSGKCYSGCKDTWYGDTCNNKCSSKCKQSNCYQSGSVLSCTTGCIDGYKGSYCQDTCLDNCISCNRYNNQCTSCKTGWYGDTCQTKCNSNCINRCHQATGRCTSCKDGYHGSQCKEECPDNCLGNCNQDSAHCKSCKSGTFGDYCNETCSTVCLPGKDQSTCDRDGRCTVGCINGRYGNNCNGKCSTGCMNGTCNRNDGGCISGCIPGKSGTNCTEDCSENCIICNQYDNKNCSQCYDGYYGQSCKQPCSKTCQSQNNNLICNKINGYCTIGCIKGYYGDVCNKECSYCFEKTCNHTNGFCTNGCVAGKMGDNCTEDCPKGTYGLRCNSTCGNCYNHTICHTVTGYCDLVGCQSGFQGSTCKEVLVEEPYNSSIIITAVIVTLVVVIVVVIGLVIFLRRKQQKSEVTLSAKDDISLSTRRPLYENVNISDKSKCNSFIDSSSINNVSLDLEEIEDTQQQIYQNIGIVKPISSTRVDLPDLWDYSQDNRDQIAVQYKNLPKGLCRPHAICLNEINGPKNRYKNVCAFDDTRVKLQPIENDPNSDYINACYITKYDQTSKYIASQGPITVNMEEFIRMIWDVDTSKIVMLTNLVENAIEKCKQYWPAIGKTQQFGQINMKLIKEEVYAHFTIRELQITKTKSEPRIFRQYHYTSWPDKGVPSDIASLVEFRNKVHKSITKRSGPMIVHCSAGIGRTGTFLALDYLIQQAQAENSVDICSCVSKMRQERVNMVQTVAQYILLHDALTVWYIVGDTTSVTNYPQIYNQLLKVDEQTNKSQLHNKYQLMNTISCKIDKDGYSEALKPENKNKNRNQHVLAANSARLMIVRTAYENSSDYINAVYLPSYKKKKGYISTQTPQPNTVEDFWLMVLHSETKVIISLDDKKAKNIGEYLPKTEIKFGEMTIKRVNEDSNNTGYYDVIFCEISQETDNIRRTVKVYQCHFWKGLNKIPASSMSIFTLLEEISSINDSGPLVVSCLNGANKSGLLCVLAAILERLTIEQDVSIIQTILQLRISRPEIINSFEQFQFCFEAIGEYLDNFSNYANSC